MELGVHIVSFNRPDGAKSIASTLGATAEAAEEIGVGRISLMDHYFQLEMMGGKAEDPMLEGYTGLGFLAAKTRKAQVGLLVTGVTYRLPGLLAKIVTTLDILSGGRAFLGIGAGWYEREHKAFGVPFPAIRERLQRLDETLQICKQMWSDNDGAFEGEQFQLAETLCSPMPLRKPHPPIMVGGSGEKVLLKLVARHADACNLFSALGQDGLSSKLDILRRHCDKEKRDYDTIQKTMLWVGAAPVGDAADGFLSEMEGMAKLGFTEVIVMPMGDDPVGWVRSLAPAARRLADIG